MGQQTLVSVMGVVPSYALAVDITEFKAAVQSLGQERQGGQRVIRTPGIQHFQWGINEVSQLTVS